MSLFDSASLVVTPNGVKEGKLYSIKPSDGSGDLSVTRATTATRVNSSGLVEVVPRNLVTYSNTFTNAAWTKNNATITANSIANPINGLIDANIITANANVGYINSSSFYLSVGKYTISMFAKKNNTNFCSIEISDGISNSGKAWYNLTNGANGTTGGTYSVSNQTAVSYNNGWYLLKLTINVTSAGNYFFVPFFVQTNGALSQTNDSGYAYGVQVESGEVTTDYYPTTTRLNIPRLDYTNGSCPSILVEPQRTNLMLNSQNFAAASWTAVATTITANAGISPDGTNNANKFIPSTLATSHYISQVSISSTNGSISIYAKADGYNNITLLTSNTNVNYNLSTGTVQAVGGVGTGAIQSVGNGWYRCILFKVLTAEAIFISCGSNTNAGFFNGSGNGTSGVLIWGAQVEVGAYPTSYIPTTSASVTRNADVISKTGISSLIGQTEGTLYCEIKAIADDNVEKHITLSDGTNNNIVDLYYGFWGAGSVFCGVKVAGTTQGGLLNGPLAVASMNKIAVVYKTNRFELWINGTKVMEDLSGNTFTGTTLSKLETAVNGANPFFGNINSIQLYKTALSSDELAKLTTI